MRTNTLKTIIKTTAVAALVLLLGASVSFAQSVNLTAQRQHALLPDGRSVPMWGLLCTGASGASCSSLHYNGTAYDAQAGGDSWQPPLIIVPPGALTINLTNALSFDNGNTVPTSLVIVGQLGGGLGSEPSGRTDPASAFPHPTQGTTWPIAGGTGPDDTVFTPPDQAGRVRSFGTEVLTTSGAVGLQWNLKPGTYLLESGTHPSIQGPMGLYGVVVVTTPGTAYPAVAATGIAPATAAVTYNADVPLLFSEIDATQNISVDQAVNTSGFLETRKWNSLLGECGDPSIHTCYPPAVNYSPRYYLINGVSFDRNAANLGKSLFATNPSSGVTPGTGQVLVRIVNAGLSTHIPSIVGAQTGSPAVSGFSLIAEDGNVLPGNHRVQSEVLMVAGKTYDLMINAPASGAAALPIYDRQLSLSTNNQRDGGMQGYIGANGATLDTAGIGLTAAANPDVYYLVPGNTLTVSDPGAGVLANDVGVYGATVTGTVTGLTKFKVDGTFVYSGAVPATFNYCANTGSPCTTVTINTCDSTTMVGGKACQGGSPLAASDAYSSTATKLHISPPGVLINDSDPDGHPLKAVFESANGVCASATLSDDGAFTATASGSGNCVITYHDVNSQNVSSNSTTATITFPAPSNITVNVQDALSHVPITDYRWIIEEDRTFQINPATQVQTPGANVPSLGTSFHTSNMPVVASGCVGDVACESGQTVLDGTGHVPAVCDIGNGVCHAGTEKDPLQPGQVALDPNRRYYLSVLPGDAANGFNSGAGGPVVVDDQAVTITQSGPTNNRTVTVTLPAGQQSGLQVGDIVDVTIPGSIPNSARGDRGKHAVLSLSADGRTFTYAGTGGNFSATAGSYDFSRPFSLARDCPTPSDYSPTGVNSNGDPAQCGHTMGGTPIVPTCTTTGCTLPTSVTVNVEPTPLPTAQIAVYIFEDDWPLNGENDAGGGVDTLATQETGLGGFEIVLFDQAGGFGDATGQPTYDMFNMPLSNSLAGTPDPMHPGNDACPITQKTDGLVGMIVTCPHFESDGVTPSPLEGQALIKNLYPGLYEVFATPGADRIAKGEEWLQTNTLDGTKPHEAFIKAGEPAYFQEFGPAGYHVSIGFANPKIINARGAQECAVAGSCQNQVHGKVTTVRISRTPDERLYSSGDYTANSFTQCYVSLGDPDEEDFFFTKCGSDGSFSFPTVPDGTWRITVFDQWNDLLVDGLSTPVAVGPNHRDGDMGDVSMQQWRTNLYTSTFFDNNGNGIIDDDENGLALVPVNIRYRDGSYAFFNNTDLAGSAGFNEIFPFFNWLVVEADTTRYKQTGVHVVYDAGGPADGAGGGPGGQGSMIADHTANTNETVPLPTNLRVPGAVYCSDADCLSENRGNNPLGGGLGGSTGRIDPPSFTSEGFQGFIGAAEFLEFGKKPFNPGENGGIRGHVLYMSTRPFDDPALLLQLSWTPGVPNVRINLYKEGTAPDGTKSLTLVDHTETTSWDKWAQGFRSDGVPNMNCPGMANPSAFFYTLQNSTQWLDQPLFTGDPASPHTLPNQSQFKCFDGLQSFNQVQPAPYDGMYQFPSVTSVDNSSGRPTGTNCTICTSNPSSTDANSPNYDPFHAGLPMLPAGKYVVEVVVPPGYELVKEEDKNILIGDNYIAPVTQQFGGLGSIFIMPDQAAVAEATNPNNPQNQTIDLGSQPRHEGDTGSVETFWPCVGESRVVPDFISLFPNSQEVSPFAGATRNLCDRKEVTLEDQMTALAKFYVFSSTHLAAHYTGIITDDFASEFDPFAPTFGEKFAVPNLPVSVKDFNGVEIARTYADQWGIFNGLNYSTWEVNPPNPTGYAPTMMVMCMNDPGPIPDPTHPGQMITDPLYNPGYSQFCYEWSFMPGQTAYLDTPVVPTSAFADAYNPPDCAYPDATPAIKDVNGDGVGPWVSASGPRTLTINAQGTVNNVLNPNYSGPQADSSPYNQKFVTRHYGFGDRPTSCPASGVCPNVTVGGIPLVNVTTWNDGQIVGTVQNGSTASTQVPQCTIQQRGTGNGGARCGELLVTAANGKKSIDTVTVTVGGKAPTYVFPGPDAIQNAIDAALPGDLLLVSPGTYDERLLMWKPVRLQGVGAASVTVIADAHPSGKMDVWRRKVNCLFGIGLNGALINNNTTSPSFNLYDPTGAYTCQFNGTAQVDAIPGEPIVGWDANLNGNLAELLQEPTLMGAYEGAGITVLGKGLLNPNTPGVCDALDAGGCVLLSTNQCSNNLANTNPNSRSNFWCNPSRIDGMTFTDSSAGGGGIFVHGFGHNLEISNNRVYANIGTLTGGLTVGQIETTDGTINGTQEVAFGYDRNLNVHNNSITRNGAIGDEANSTTPAAAGGVTFCTGSDSYLFNNNWVCGNMSSGDGGGVSHYGFSYNGKISNNWILFNQSNNPTLPTNGGGLSIIGAPPDGPVCENASQDQDCPPDLSDGVGPGLVIDSNFIVGNNAESGSGGGIRLQQVNGTEIARNLNNPGNWYDVTITNNIIANNVAGWDGGGVSMQDALRVSFINNTVVNNDTTATAGVLFNTLGAANANVPPPGCNPQPDPQQPQDPSCINPVVTSTNQAAGLVTMQHTPNMAASIGNANIRCPAGNFNGSNAVNGQCKQISYPLLRNNLFWQNRAFHITVGNLGSELLDQQNIVTLVPQVNQASMGQCFPNGTNFWDIGVRGDTGPTSHTSNFTLNPTNSILSSGNYTGSGNIFPAVANQNQTVSEYCNGARVPPLAHVGPTGYGVDPGIADATLPNPLFSLTPAATVDEGNNWVNLAYGPLALANDQGVTMGDYRICGNSGAPAPSCTAQSPAVNAASATSAPNHDFFGTTRPQNGAFDIGAVEFVGTIGGGGGGGTNPNRPNLGVLDTFNRNNSLNLGGNWSQPSLFGLAAIGINSNQALSVSFTGSFGNAMWNGTGNVFGTTQGAAFTFANTPMSNTALMLKGTGTTNGQGLMTNFVRVRYSTGGTLTIETTTNNGGAFTPAGTLTGFGDFASGDTMTVLVDNTGTLWVWKNASTTPIGGAGIALPAGFAGTGRIGMQMPIGARVDNFSGGTI